MLQLKLPLCESQVGLSCVQVEPACPVSSRYLSSPLFCWAAPPSQRALCLWNIFCTFLARISLFLCCLSLLILCQYCGHFLFSPNSLIANFLSCPEANFQGDLVANFQSGPLAGCQTPPASPSPTCALGSQTLLHDSQLRWGWWECSKRICWRGRLQWWWRRCWWWCSAPQWARVAIKTL